LQRSIAHVKVQLENASRRHKDAEVSTSKVCDQVHDQTSLIQVDALPSPLLDPLEGPSTLNCGKLGLEGRSQLPALKGGRGAC
jgi:hypothetical protein